MTAIPDTMRAEISDRLRILEAEESIRILFAVESGSRAWGFHSSDSDYDVRFVYTRPIEWHYRLGKKRDVVERPIDDDLDLSGWELSKALSLALGSNAVIAEWLQSPIRYLEIENAVSALTDFTARVLDRKSVSWHYLSLAERQLDRLHGADGRIRIKRYFYVLRPVLALRWMRLANSAMPPMQMTALRQGVQLDAAESDALDDLTAKKQAATERGTMTEGVPVLDQLVQAEMELARGWLADAPKTSPTAFWDQASALHLRLSLGPHP